ncbi:TRAP-type C4-dicarboxylate transport system permease small subunit [Neobacillus niacini]|uniref:TRAP transporter small permease subunit n=1 Tax=Neobacillus niacini TaxID=86668 RepID=UPI00285A6A91|nr:TRAP transporter small permease [Neobacillus niacini]MDR7075745.1 TRAP-type C4-dicarboxylate transport system permease small subunit [Neobacillus niacini]
MKIVNKTIRFINYINQQMYVVIGVIITFLSLMIFYDVIARYFFERPTRFGFDTSVWLTAVMAFIGGGYAILKNEHVRVDMYYAKFSDKGKAIVDLISHLFIFLTVIALVFWGGQHVLDLYKKGVVATTGLNIPMWIKWSILPIGGTLLGLQALVTLFKDIYLLITGRKYEVDNDKEIYLLNTDRKFDLDNTKEIYLPNTDIKVEEGK